MLKFFWRHVWPSLIIVVSAAISIASIILDGLHAVELGLPWWVYHAIGLALFFAGILVLLYRVVNEMSDKLNGDSPPEAASTSPQFPHPERKTSEAYSRDSDIAPLSNVGERDVLIGQQNTSAKPEEAKKLSLASPVMEKVFLSESITPKYLMEIYRDHMEVHAQSLAQSYLNKWMRISGVLRQVSPLEGGTSGTVFASLDIPTDGQPSWVALSSISLFFSYKWMDRLSAMKRGDKLTVIGKLSLISSSSLRLSDCEVLNISTTT